MRRNCYAVVVLHVLQNIMDLMTKCSGCGEMKSKSNFSRYVKDCRGLMSSNVSVKSRPVTSNSSSRSSSGARPATTNRSEDVRQAEPFYTETYEPTGLPTMLCSIIPGAFNELLEQHQSYNLQELANFLGIYFPEIPAKYPKLLSSLPQWRPIVWLLFTSSARKTSSRMIRKRCVAAEAASTLSQVKFR